MNLVRYFAVAIVLQFSVTSAVAQLRGAPVKPMPLPTVRPLPGGIGQSPGVGSGLSIQRMEDDARRLRELNRQAPAVQAAPISPPPAKYREAAPDGGGGDQQCRCPDRYENVKYFRPDGSAYYQQVLRPGYWAAHCCTR